MTRMIQFGVVFAVAAAVWSCTSDEGSGDEQLGVTNPMADAAPTAEPSPSSGVDDGASPEPVPVTDAGCHTIVVFATPHWGGESIAVPLCEEDVGCDTGDDEVVLALDPEGTCWAFPNPCVPEIWIAQGWEEVLDCPMPPTPEAGTDASAPETDAGNLTSPDGAASLLDAAPIDASADAAPKDLYAWTTPPDGLWDAPAASATVEARGGPHDETQLDHDAGSRTDMLMYRRP